jgi:hypothetical protein
MNQSHKCRCERALVAACAICASILLNSLAPAAEIDIQIGAGATATIYKPFDVTLPASTPVATIWVWVNADTDPAKTDIRATQRNLGYREVEYKGLFSQQLALTQVTPTSSGDVTTYGMGWSQQRHSPLKQIDPGNAARLQAVWNLSLDNPANASSQPL